MRQLALLLCLTSPVAVADDLDCLAKTIYGEARGESVAGAVAVAQATLQHAIRFGKGVCEVPARRQPIPVRYMSLYRGLAETAINVDTAQLAPKADSWNTGTKPAYKGRVVAVIGKHVFYIREDDHGHAQQSALPAHPARSETDQAQILLPRQSVPPRTRLAAGDANGVVPGLPRHPAHEAGKTTQTGRGKPVKRT